MTNATRFVAGFAGLAISATICSANPPTADVNNWNMVNIVDNGDGTYSVPRVEYDNQQKNNCYNYGVNTKTNTFAQPGRKGSSLKIKDYRDFMMPYMLKCKNGTANEADYCAVGLQFQQWAVRDGLEVVAQGDVDPTMINDLGEGYCLVALVVGCIENPPGSGNFVMDYHWYRQNGDKKWSHKPGNGRATTKDNKNGEITDPSSLPDLDNNDANDKTDYDKFITYMKYKPGVEISGEDPVPFVDLPPGVGRVTSTTRTNVPYGWCLEDSLEIEFITDTFLLDQIVVPDPQWWAEDNGFAGVMLEFAEGTLPPPFNGVPISVRAYQGVKEISTVGQDGEITRQYTMDFGLEQWVVEQAQVRDECLPCQELLEPIDCIADCDANGSLDILDFVCFQSLFLAGDPAADVNGDGQLNILDFVAFQEAFLAGCE